MPIQHNNEEYLDLDESADYIGITRYQLNRIARFGKELDRNKIGRKLHIKKNDIIAWQQLKSQRKVSLDKNDFLKDFYEETYEEALAKLKEEEKIGDNVEVFTPLEKAE